MTQETAAQNMKQFKSRSENKKIEELKRKQMHGHFYRDLERTSVDKQKSQAWLCSSGLQGETEFSPALVPWGLCDPSPL
jgi:hypothetical protein